MKETFETPESFTEIVVVLFLVCSLWIDLRHGPFLLLNLFEIISDFESLPTETFKQAQMTWNLVGFHFLISYLISISLPMEAFVLLTKKRELVRLSRFVSCELILIEWLQVCLPGDGGPFAGILLFCTWPTFGALLQLGALCPSLGNDALIAT